MSTDTITPEMFDLEGELELSDEALSALARLLVDAALAERDGEPVSRKVSG